MSSSSLPLLVIVPIFEVPTLMTVRLPFHRSRCLFTHLPSLFFLLFIKPSNSIIAVRHLRRSLVTMPRRTRYEFISITHLHDLAKRFTTDALPATNLTIFPGSGQTSENARMCLFWPSLRCTNHIFQSHLFLLVCVNRLNNVINFFRL